MLDDNRPVLTVTYPRAGVNPPVERILVYDTGLDMQTFSVMADFEIDGVTAGRELSDRFSRIGDGVYEWKLGKPRLSGSEQTLTVRVRDRQGNTSTVRRTFAIEMSR